MALGVLHHQHVRIVMPVGVHVLVSGERAVEIVKGFIKRRVTLEVAFRSAGLWPPQSHINNSLYLKALLYLCSISTSNVRVSSHLPITAMSMVVSYVVAHG